MPKKNSPGCACCQLAVECQYFDETFDVGLSAWTQVSGTWTVTGGKVETTSTNAILKCNTEHPDDVPDYSIRFKTNATTSTGGLVRLIVDYTDADNYAFLEIQWETPPTTAEFMDTGGYLRFGTRIGGVETWIGDESGWGHPQPARSAIDVVGPNQEHTFTVCLLNNFLRVVGSGASGLMVPYTPVSGSGFFALGTGGTVPDAIKFSTATATKTGGACATCKGCFNCAGSIPVNPVQVTVTGATGDAATINGTHTLSFAYERNAVCAWVLILESPIGCGFTEIVYYASGGFGGGSGDGSVNFTVGPHHDASSPREIFEMVADFTLSPCDPADEEFAWFPLSAFPPACAVEEVETAVVTVEAVTEPPVDYIDFCGCIGTAPDPMTATFTSAYFNGEISLPHSGGTFQESIELECGDILTIDVVCAGGTDVSVAAVLQSNPPGTIYYSGEDSVNPFDCDPFEVTAVIDMGQLNSGTVCAAGAMGANFNLTVILTE